MPRNKLKKYADIDTFPNVIYRPDSLAKKWNSAFFKNNNPITLELGCGTGVLTLELARRHPDKNYIGIDNKRARVWSGAVNALFDELLNVAFITTRIEALEEFFGHGEISEIWITFPDPYPKPSKSNKRLISPELLNKYRNFITPECVFHFKTDDEKLFDFAIETLDNEKAVIQQIAKDTHGDRTIPDDVKIKTYYEKRHLEEGKTIKYVRFTLN